MFVSGTSLTPIDFAGLRILDYTAGHDLSASVAVPDSPFSRNGSIGPVLASLRRVFGRVPLWLGDIHQHMDLRRRPFKEDHNGTPFHREAM